MKRKLCFLLLLCLFFGATAQQINNTQSVAGLQIGDPVPGITIRHIINYHSGKAGITDFSGKLLILDFWATWCSGCLQNMPRMETLQQKFAGKIQILAVTYQDSSQIQKFLNTMRDIHGRPYNFTTAVNDTVLNRLFPHQFIPHCVWIGPDQKVLAITGAEEVNEANITRMLGRQDITLVEKTDIDPNRPLFLLANVPADSLSYYSILLKGHYSGLGSGTRFRRKGQIIYGRAITNSNLIFMYEAAAYPLFKKLGDTYSRKRLVLEVKDTSKLMMTRLPDGTWDSAAQYNYDIIVPVNLADSLYNLMLAGLNRSGPYIGTIQDRVVECLVLSMAGTAGKLSTKGGDPVNTLFYGHPALLRNYPLSYFINRLNEAQEIPYPVIDETGYTGNVDIQLTGLSDIRTLRKELQPYGLKLSVAKRRIHVFVLADKLPLSAAAN